LLNRVRQRLHPRLIRRRTKFWPGPARPGRSGCLQLSRRRDVRPGPRRGSKGLVRGSDALGGAAPDELAIFYRSDLGGKDLWYGNGSLTLFDPKYGLHATIAVPSTIDAMLDQVADKQGLTNAPRRCRSSTRRLHEHARRLDGVRGTAKKTYDIGSFSGEPSGTRTWDPVIKSSTPDLTSTPRHTKSPPKSRTTR
jgi:hypothetical protein